MKGQKERSQRWINQKREECVKRTKGEKGEKKRDNNKWRDGQ